MFVPDEIAQIQKEWENYFPGPQERGRDGRVWFCLAPNQVVDRGTDKFFRYFGGEAIYMPVTCHASIARKLEAIGRPVVVEVSINPKELRAFGDFPFALNALSLFHRSKNPNAHIHSSEGYLERNVLPDEVLRVSPKDEFFNAYSDSCSS